MGYALPMTSMDLGERVRLRRGDVAGCAFARERLAGSSSTAKIARDGQMRPSSQQNPEEGRRLEEYVLARELRIFDLLLERDTRLGGDDQLPEADIAHRVRQVIALRPVQEIPERMGRRTLVLGSLPDVIDAHMPHAEFRGHECAERRLA